jgi:hypothetical protein
MPSFTPMAISLVAWSSTSALVYSFFSGGGTAGAGVGAAPGVTVPGSGAGVVPGDAVTGMGIVTAPGASCQWPCSVDHAFPGGGSPGGCGAGVNCCCCWGGKDAAVGRAGTVKVCAGGVPPAADCGAAAGKNTRVPTEPAITPTAAASRTTQPEAPFFEAATGLVDFFLLRLMQVG